MVAVLDKDRVFMLIKFSNNKNNLVSLQKGTLWMNSGKYFIEREKKDGEQGIGDKYEGSAVVSNVRLRFYKQDTDELVLEGEAGRLGYADDAIVSKPMLCLTHISHDSLKVITEYEESVDCCLDFEGLDKEKIIKDFGEYALIISPNEFLEQVKRSFSEQNIRFVADKVSYEDFSVNSQKRLEDYNKGNPSLFFYKDKSFQHQKEYRIVILNHDTDADKAFTPCIGNMEGFSYLLETRELFSGKFALNISRA